MRYQRWHRHRRRHRHRRWHLQDGVPVHLEALGGPPRRVPPAQLLGGGAARHQRHGARHHGRARLLRCRGVRRRQRRSSSACSSRTDHVTDRTDLGCSFDGCYCVLPAPALPAPARACASGEPPLLQHSQWSQYRRAGLASIPDRSQLGGTTVSRRASLPKQRLLHTCALMLYKTDATVDPQVHPPMRSGSWCECKEPPAQAPARTPTGPPPEGGRSPSAPSLLRGVYLVAAACPWASSQARTARCSPASKSPPLHLPRGTLAATAATSCGTAAASATAGGGERRGPVPGTAPPALPAGFAVAEGRPAGVSAQPCFAACASASASLERMSSVCFTARASSGPLRPSSRGCGAAGWADASAASRPPSSAAGRPGPCARTIHTNRFQGVVCAAHPRPYFWQHAPWPHHAILRVWSCRETSRCLTARMKAR